MGFSAQVIARAQQRLSEKKADQEEISVALYAFVMRMARCCGTVGTTAFEKAVKYIENRYYKDISVEDIAKNGGSNTDENVKQSINRNLSSFIRKNKYSQLT